MKQCGIVHRFFKWAQFTLLALQTCLMNLIVSFQRLGCFTRFRFVGLTLLTLTTQSLPEVNAGFELRLKHRLA